MAAKKTSTLSSKQKRRHRLYKRIAWTVLAFLGITLLALFFWVKSLQYPASERAMEEFRSANVTETSDYILFDADHEKGVLLIQGGALVEVQAYSYLAEQISQEGYDVYLLKAPFNLPILTAGAATQLIQQKQLTNVFLMGHSLGGTISAQTALDSPSKGLILLASYPGPTADLSKLDLPVLSITASEDQILNQANYQEAINRLPAITDYQTIEGGNHAGFGLYGKQKGDGQMTITPMEQQDRVYHLILHFLEGNR